MAIIIGIWGGLAAFAGFIFMTSANSAIHEIEAGLAFLIATVALGSAGIIEAVNRNTKNQRPREEQAPASSMSEPFYK